ncbi:ParB/RepB/Spo0J family partition protein [Paenibacillus koleovorans]|uniref:ParB/RepB/Spo0J family partition protein n=1 Tax=Paenibacillus koleovorans TaxID=121608 RepID=UPI000FD86B9C|nr:ParB/RepB/Spo0J family partition protein [Paenibacillus koleovorans]
MDIIELAIELIDEDTDQPRYQFDETALQELMNSIAELGLLSPIKVRKIGPDRYKIVYGNRRYKASKMLGRPTIPCIVTTATDEMDIYLEQIAENLTREGFSPIEEAEAFHKLMNDPKFNSSVKFLSSKLGKPESYIKNKCELLKFGPAVKKLIVSGTQIRKDCLTEDQLLPLKDLPLEYRDPLAKCAARDELPVSDVKKIALLFKDSAISDSTKNKLLYKSGPELLETWSALKASRAAREKALPEAKPAGGRAGKGAAAEAAQAAAPSAAATAAAAPAAPAASAADATGTAAPEAGATAASGLAAVAPAAKAPAAASPSSPLEGLLHSLLAALPATSPLTPELLQALDQVADKAAFRTEVDRLILSLEEHLNEWKTIQKRSAG